MKEKKITMDDILYELAEKLISKYNFKTISGKKDDEMYVYMNGIYEGYGRDAIRIEVQKALGSLCKNHSVSEVIGKVARKTLTERENMSCKDTNLICVENGVLDLEKMELMPHNPEYRFMSKIPVFYKKGVKCSKIIDFLSKVIVEEDELAIQEWFGFMLYREYFVKKAVILRGPRDTGKTSFLNLVLKFIGEKNVSNKSMQKLAEGKWQVAKLYNKHANVADDLNSEDIYNMGIFKQLTGRSSIDGEYKFGDSFEFINWAKLMNGCNKIPKIKGDEDDEAFWDRWMIFDFDNVFDKKDKNTNPDIINRITTQKEMSGLLNWAIEGLKRLQKKKYFSYRRDWEENRRIMQGEASSVAKFSSECLIGDIESWISNYEFYEVYKEYCRLNSITNIESDQKFAKDIRKYCSFGVFGKKIGEIWGVRGIKIRRPIPIMGL